MDNIEISILNYENQLLASRKQLNDLIYAYHNRKVDSSLLNHKISYLQNEIDYMNHQLDVLKAELNGHPQTSCMPPQNAEHPQASYTQSPNAKQSQDAAQSQAACMQSQNVEQSQDTEQSHTPCAQPQVTKRPDTAPARHMDLENIIGKSWMGIFASVLIFVSFILFATLLAPFITDTVKMAAMYIVSILFTVFGLIKLKKHHNKLYLAISSCGVGAVYISLLLTNLYFKAIGDVALYLLILVWAVFVCYLSRWQDRVFQIIGQCGITIALLFGIILCVKTEDTAKFFLLSLFFVVTATIFYMSNYSREFHKNIISNVFNIVNVFQLIMGFCLFDTPALFSLDKLSEGWTAYRMEIAGMVILLFLVLQFVLFLIAGLKENNTGFGMIMIANAILMMLSIGSMTYGAGNNSRGIPFLVIGFFFLAVIEKKFNNREDNGKILMQLFSLPLFIFSVYMITFFQNHIGLSFLMILFILLGYYMDDNVYKYESLVMAVVYCFITMKYPIEHFCLGLLFFAILSAFMYIKKEQYRITFKLYSYFAGLLFICMGLINIFDDINISYDISETVILTVTALLNVLAMKSRFTKNFQTLQTEKACVVATRITNALFMVCSLSAVMDTDNEICHCILILLAICIFMANTRNLLGQNKRLWPGIYIGIKLTVLIVTILSSFDAANYVISVSALLFAIISIIVGFRFYFKSFRVYGLILSLLSVAKLILVDISYDNTLGHALSFFVCGLLCFVISLIYHLIDRKVQDDSSGRNISGLSENGDK